ncbi:MAG: nuclear transport factor 2 family protein, partial [Actinomycetota bacterium]
GGGDGGADASDEQLALHAAEARRFLEVGVRNGDLAVAAELLTDGFRFHSATGPVGADVATERIAGGRPLNVKNVIASGDLVVAHVHVEGEEPHVSWDVFRMVDGRIAEMWSVHQPIAPPEEQANTHPHF